MERGHRLEVRAHDRGVRGLEPIERPVEVHLAIVQHDDARLQPAQQVLVVRDDHRRRLHAVDVALVPARGSSTTVTVPAVEEKGMPNVFAIVSRAARAEEGLEFKDFFLFG